MKVILYLGHRALAYGWGVNYHVPPRPPTWYEPIFAPGQPAYAGPKKGKGKKRAKAVIKTVAETPPGMEQWVKENKARFTHEYGDKGRELLYRTAWSLYNKRSKGGKTRSNDGLGVQPSQVKTMKNDDVILEKMRDMSPYPKPHDIRT